MSKNELANAYRNGQLTRRGFIRRMAALGVSVAAASAYADLLAPASKAAAVVRAQSFYDTSTTEQPTSTTTAPPAATTTTGPSSTSTTSKPSSTTTTTTATTQTQATVLGSSTVPPGGAVTVTAAGFAPNTTANMTLFSDPVSLGTTQADATGTVRATVRIPANTTAGQHTIVITGPGATGGTNQASATITVTGTSGQIAVTGSNAEKLGVLGAAAAALGAVVHWADRRSRPKGNDSTEP